MTETEKREIMARASELMGIGYGLSEPQIESAKEFSQLDNSLFDLLAAMKIDPYDFARDGWAKTPGGDLIDAFYVRRWERWRDQHHPNLPDGHKWSRGTVAVALALAERRGQR